MPTITSVLIAVIVVVALLLLYLAGYFLGSIKMFYMVQTHMRSLGYDSYSDAIDALTNGFSERECSDEASQEDK